MIKLIPKGQRSLPGGIRPLSEYSNRMSSIDTRSDHLKSQLLVQLEHQAAQAQRVRVALEKAESGNRRNERQRTTVRTNFEGEPVTETNYLANNLGAGLETTGPEKWFLEYLLGKPLFEGASLATRYAGAKFGGLSAFGHWSRNSLLANNLKLWSLTEIPERQVSASFVLGSGNLRYGYDPTDAKHVDLIGKHFKAKYPLATISSTPTKSTFGWDNDPILITGEMPASKQLQIAANLVRGRLNNLRYGWGPNADLEWNYVGGQMRHLSPEYLLKELGNSSSELFLPLNKGADHAHGWYDNGRVLLRMDPWRSKPVLYTAIHEGISHPTDLMVMAGNPTLGIMNKITGAPLEQDYRGLSEPIDLFGDLVKQFGKDSLKPREARAMHLEMMSKLLANGAKEKGISPTQVLNSADNGESIIAEQIEKTLTSPEELAKFMNTFDSAYLKDYASLLTSPNTSSVAKEAYLNRWKKMLKFAPALTGVTITNSLKFGGKLISKRK